MPFPVLCNQEDNTVFVHYRKRAFLIVLFTAEVRLLADKIARMTDKERSRGGTSECH